ncbi:ScyD/ScyE family protein [Actinotalea solisilvae]|uniref:ScyD/ScyE family protein n=1 Tax=Actinotalea solisilvae TaxID=2072922 RepID=UPI0018F199E2|nr:ScyD/ScyE family protein [Actinotalea solisilvae]
MRNVPRSAVPLVSSALVLAAAVPAAASAPTRYPPSHDPVVVASGLVGPLSFDVTARGDLYVGQSFAGILTHVTKEGERHDLVSVAPAGVGAVSEERGTVTWAEREAEGFAVTSSVLVRRAPDGTTTEVDLLAYEAAANPDAVNTYGIQGLDAACAATIPAELAPFLLPYQGQVDTNAYSSVTSGGTTYVADAGANAIFAVSASGEVSTVAVLPPTVIPITEEIAAAQGFDPCVAGHDFWAEPVPTDVELGRHGTLYVTSLPGGAEDDSLGANGAVYRVSPGGDVELVARGFLGATNLAVAPSGTIYVTELFAGRLSAVSRSGEVSTVTELVEPAAVEWARGRLYVATQVFGDGTIVTLSPRG